MTFAINGPNLNMLRVREPEVTGTRRTQTSNRHIRDAQRCGVAVELFQSNHEGAIVDKIRAYGTFEASSSTRRVHAYKRRHSTRSGRRAPRGGGAPVRHRARGV